MGVSAIRPGPSLGLMALLVAACTVEGQAPVLGSAATAPVERGVERMVMPPALPGRLAALNLPDLSQPPPRPEPAPPPVTLPVAAPPPAPEPEPIAPPAPAPAPVATAMAAAPVAVPPAANSPVAVAPVIVAAVAQAPPPPDPAPVTEAPAPAPAPAPEPRPAPPIVVAVAPPPEPAPRPPATPLPAPPREAREGPRVQLVAAGSEAEAMRHWARLTQQVPELTEGRTPLVLTLERPDQPTIFRLRLGGFASAEAAQAWCAQLRARGPACWVSG